MTDKGSLRPIVASLLSEGNVSVLLGLLATEGLEARLRLPIKTVRARLDEEADVALAAAAAAHGAHTVKDVLRLLEREGFKPSTLHKAVGGAVRRQVQGALADLLLGEEEAREEADAAAKGQGAPAPAPPMTDAALEAWARENHVLAHLDRSVWRALGEAGEWRASQLLSRVSPTPTVRDLLVEDGTRRLGPALPASDLARAQRSVQRALLAAAARIKRALERELSLARRHGPLEDPVLRGLADALLRTLPAIVSEPIVEPATRSEARILFHPSPAGFEVRFAWDARSWQACTHAVRIDVDALPDGPVEVRCGCKRQGCGNALGAVHALLTWLHGSQGAEQQRVARTLTAPRWQRALDLLDGGLAAAEAAEPRKDARVTWRLDEHAGRFTLKPFLHRPLKAGGWSAGTPLGKTGYSLGKNAS